MLLQIDPMLAIEPEEIDRRLAAGWFRAGPLWIQTPLVILAEGLRPTIHVRIDLSQQPPSRSRRRLLRRNRERFRLVEGPARVDPARERLYRGMKPRFSGFVSEDLAPLILDELRPRGHRTRELAVYDADRLIAVSYYEPGTRAVAGLLGLYDPAYARFGLGRYTMLEDIELARRHGARFYYPGYVIPGAPGFDYKLSVGAAEALDETGRWQAFDGVPSPGPLVPRIEERSRALATALDASGVPWGRRLYPLLWLPGVQFLDRPYVGTPLHLRCFPEHAGRVQLIAEYRPESDRFALCHVSIDPELDTTEGLDPDTALMDPDRFQLSALYYRDELCVDSRPEPIARAAREAGAPTGDPQDEPLETLPTGQE